MSVAAGGEWVEADEAGDEAVEEVDFGDEEDDAEISASDNRLVDADDFATVASVFVVVGAESAASSPSVSSEP